MGKPLIGDAQMLAIHETMLRLRALQREAEHLPLRHGASRASGVSRPRSIALLAATLLQLRPVDTLLAEVDDAFAAEVLAAAQESTFAPESQVPVFVAGAGAAGIAAGFALAQSRSSRPGDNAPVTVGLLTEQSVPLMGDALQLASEAVLPLLLIVQCGDAARSKPIDSLPNVEVVRIDADDAVACCRVMQESLLRTRNRWGSVVLQAVTLPGSADPLASFEGHLRRRNLAFRA